MHVGDPLRSALERVGAHMLSLADPRYPPLLREIHDPPPLLYVRGNADLLLQPQLAIVGARRASAVGLRLASRIAAALAGRDLVVTSGLALGIDGAAHRGALEAGGGTVAVLGTGVETIYPRRNRALGEDIALRGCLVSEYPPGTAPLPGRFPRRNRIISGMSLGTLVVEAALPSGSLITASTATSQGREVFALPWSLAHKGGAGCLQLLRDGAKMVTRVEDILEELGVLGGLQLDLLRGLRDTPGAVEKNSPLLDLIGQEAVAIDELVCGSGLPAAEVLAELSRLELQGYVQRSSGGYIRV